MRNDTWDLTDLRSAAGSALQDQQQKLWTGLFYRLVLFCLLQTHNIGTFAPCTTSPDVSDLSIFSVRNIVLCQFSCAIYAPLQKRSELIHSSLSSSRPSHVSESDDAQGLR